MMRRLLICGALLIAAPATALAQNSPPMAASAMAPPAADYVMMAGQSDTFEVQSGQLAAHMANSENLKKFGAKMVTDHTTSTQMVMAAAHKSGMNPSPPPLKPEQQQMLADLQSVKGAAFDKMYVSQQLKAHQDALDLQSSYAKSGDDPNLKAAAARIVPVVKMHMSMLAKMGDGTTSSM
jgi:putative membrane protein